MALLDPKLDVVFKLLFAAPRNEALLRSLLTSVLRPPSPIARLRVVDPELPRDLATDRGVRLDVLVELADGRQIDVEMECDPRRAHGERWLYHWARLYSSRIRRGDEFDDLEPVVCIVFLGAPTKTERFHSVYEVREAHHHAPLCDALAVHLIELSQLEQGADEDEDPRLYRWARFLRFDEPEALTLLAKEDPIMADAKEALELLSKEPSAQRLAEMRREAEIERRLDRAAERKEGRAEGLAEGLREAVRSLCAVLGIELNESRRARIAAATDAELAALVAAIRDRRAWPE